MHSKTEWAKIMLQNWIKKYYASYIYIYYKTTNNRLRNNSISRDERKAWENVIHYNQDTHTQTLSTQQ